MQSDLGLQCLLMSLNKEGYIVRLRLLFRSITHVPDQRISSHNEPVHGDLVHVLIASVGSEGPGEPEHTHSPLLADTQYGSRGRLRPKLRSLASIVSIGARGLNFRLGIC